jgi:hypothetical protein
VVVFALKGTSSLNTTSPLLEGAMAEVRTGAYQPVQKGGVVQRGPYLPWWATAAPCSAAPSSCCFGKHLGATWAGREGQAQDGVPCGRHPCLSA